MSLLLFLDLPALSSEWSRARRSYYAAISEKDSLNSAFKQFEKIIEIDSLYQSRALAYIGSLTALKGKYTKMPWSKWKWVQRGLAILDSAVLAAPEDIEIRFLRGSTCYYLPFFFKRKQQAIEDFTTIVDLIPVTGATSNHSLLKDALEFIEKNIDLTPAQQKKIALLKR